MKIVGLHLQTAVTIPGTNVSGDFTLIPQKHKNISFKSEEYGVQINMGKHVTLTPWSNIKLVVYAPEGLNHVYAPKGLNNAE